MDEMWITVRRPCKARVKWLRRRLAAAARQHNGCKARRAAKPGGGQRDESLTRRDGAVMKI
jgi:hypothetical protein